MIPLGLAVLLFAATGIAHSIEYPDSTDAGFLAPGSTAPTGGSRLAEELRARDVPVRRETRTSDALVAAYQGRATLFVPAPALVHPDYLAMLALLPASTRVVLVDPPARVLDDGEIPLATAGRRWATRATGPDDVGSPCPLPEAREAGMAAALRQRYVTRAGHPVPLDRCYGAGLVRLRWAAAELIVIGASDPFRNDRIRERHNAALAAGLLGTSARLIWLDLSAPEPPPGTVEDPVTGFAAPPSLAPGTDGGPSRDGSSGAHDGTRVPGGQSDVDGDPAPSEPAPQAGPPTPLRDAFPAWFWAVLAQLALAILVITLWRARRLAPPVAEPLPVMVRSAETVHGRGRLYHRARARGPAASILRGAAAARLVPLLDLPPDAVPADVVAAVAGQTGRPVEEITALLYGPAPDTDDDLLHLAWALDTLTPVLAATSPLASTAPEQPAPGAPPPPVAGALPPIRRTPHDRTDEGVNR